MSEQLHSKNDLILRLTEEIPGAKEFNLLRNLVGWRLMSDADTETALANSLYCCCVRLDSALIGFARVIGDGAMYYYVQDVMIHPEYQGMGIGAAIMQRVESWLAVKQQSGSTIALLAAEGKEGFYRKFDFQLRPGPNMGAGMSKFVS